MKSILTEPRYEYKFVLERSFPNGLLNELLIHPVGLFVIHPERRVNNIYFDTEELECYRQSLEGNFKRLKMRIRWYGDSIMRANNPRLEIKYKNGLMSSKCAYPVSNFQIQESIAAGNWPQLVKKKEGGEILKNTRPTLLNFYHRHYFSDFNRSFRVTVDFDLNFIDLRKNTSLTHPLKQLGTVILEIKTEKDVQGLRDFASTLPLFLSKNSKYVSGIQIFE